MKYEHEEFFIRAYFFGIGLAIGFGMFAIYYLKVLK